MAEKTLVLKLTWENEDSFQMTSKLDDDVTVTIVKSDENNHLAETWPHIENIIRLYFQKRITEIGNEMKA